MFAVGQAIGSARVRKSRSRQARPLFIVAAGAASDVERRQPLLDVLGQKTVIIGTDPSQANLVKLLGKMMTATTLEMLGEVVAVALKRGPIHAHPIGSARNS